MNKLKLMTIIGTRPEIIRLSAVIKKCDVYFDQILVHTGQNYDYNLNQVFFEDLGLRAPDFYLDAVGKDLGETIGNIIAKSYSLMVEQKPDALLILGDTNSCLSAIAAKRLHIPIFHMEAGNRCFDECLPEETNRRIVDHISDVNMCYSEHARRYLNAEGTAKERTFVTGSPMAEVLHANLAKIEASDVLERLGLEPHKYMLLSAHREENIDTEKNFIDLFTSILVIRSFALPVFLGLAGGVSGMLLASRGYWYAWPYCLMQRGMNANQSSDMLADSYLGFALACVGWLALILLAVQLLLSHQDVKVR